LFFFDFVFEFFVLLLFFNILFLLITIEFILAKHFLIVFCRISINTTLQKWKHTTQQWEWETTPHPMLKLIQVTLLYLNGNLFLFCYKIECNGHSVKYMLNQFIVFYWLVCFVLLSQLILHQIEVYFLIFSIWGKPK
jgi:hypothetical protein